MKQKREILDYLKDIRDAIEKSEQFTKGMDFDRFARDDKTIFAVIRAFEIIGEATKNISPAVRRHYSEISWKRMAGMRDKMIHEYFGVDLKILWKTINEDFPALKPLIVKAIEQETQKGKKS
jgi:uncharacterized protein with HEPN domain